MSWFGDIQTGTLAESHDRPMGSVRVCRTCIYDERVAGITFDESGACNFCAQVQSLSDQFGTGTDKGHRELDSRLQKIRRDGQGRPYDCIIGVSGGTDSSYLIRMATKEWGLRVLAVHYDNTWNTAVASQNIAEVLSTYGTDLWTYVVDHRVADRIFKGFFFAGVPELEASTDLAYSYVLRLASSRFGVPHILEGHSFVAEGITPLNNNYFDGRYIRSVVRTGLKERRPLTVKGVHRRNRYPLMTLSKFLRHSLFSKTTFLRPLWFLKYDKASAKKLLMNETGWRDYGGHHLENRMTSFFHSVYLPKKFGIDMRNNSLSAIARAQLAPRGDLWREYCQPPYVEPGLIEYFLNRLGITTEEFATTMTGERRNWRDFKTYKRQFELLEPLFRQLAAHDRVTKSFYIKYCLR